MKTELVFFESHEEGMKGTLRGFVCITILIILDLLWFQIMDYDTILSKKVNYFSAFITYLLLCSAISVQLPSSLQEAAVYGMLVGLVTYGVFNGTNYSINKDWTVSLSIFDTLWGMFVCSVAASILYYIFHKK
jgi:uncharacterized membrane protein